MCLFDTILLSVFTGDMLPSLVQGQTACPSEVEQVTGLVPTLQCNMQSGYRCDAGAQCAAHSGLVLRTHAGLLLLPQHSRYSIPLHSCAAVWNHMCHLCHLGTHHLPSDSAGWNCWQEQAGL